jgi:HSP20 family protein
MSRQISSYNRPGTVWDFMREVETVFDDLWTNPKPSAGEPRFTNLVTPPADVHETKDFYLLTLDLPGIAQSDIKIDVQDGYLKISGERHREERKEEGLFKRYERSSGTFQRSFQLPQHVDEGKIQARMENGVLEVMVPKAEVAKPRSIKIEAEKGGLFSRLLGKNESKEETKDADKH